MRDWQFVAMGAAMVAASTASAQWTVIDLHPTGTMASDAYGVGGSQQVGIARVGPTVGHIRASLWTGSAASWVNLHPVGPDYSYAYAADAGQQVGTVTTSGVDHASLWTGTAASWVDLHPAGEFSSSAISARGGKQVGWTRVGYFRAALWSGSAASWVDLNPPPTVGYEHTSEAYAVDGSQQVGYVVNVGGVISASLWNSSSAWVNLHPSGNISSWAYGVRAGKQVGVVRVADTSSHAALWSGSAASWVDLHPAGALNSRASDVEGGRQVGYTVADGVKHAALWSGTAASWVDLHSFMPAHFTASEARSITTDGGNTIIVGWAFNSISFHEDAVMWVGPAAAPCVTDLDGSGSVTGIDLAVMLGQWTGAATYAPCPPFRTADLNHDCRVNGLDLATLLAAWGPCP